MAAAVTMLKDTEVFDAYEQGRAPLRISAPGRPVLVVFEDPAPADSPDDVRRAAESAARGLADARAGRTVSAADSVAGLRAKYGL